MLAHADFSSVLKAKAHVFHELIDQEDAPSVACQKVLPNDWVRQLAWVKTRTAVLHHNDHAVVRLQSNTDAHGFGWVGTVAVNDRVDQRFPQREVNAFDLIRVVGATDQTDNFRYGVVNDFDVRWNDSIELKHEFIGSEFAARWSLLRLCHISRRDS